jgi:hypothetical protein
MYQNKHVKVNDHASGKVCMLMESMHIKFFLLINQYH